MKDAISAGAEKLGWRLETKKYDIDLIQGNTEGIERLVLSKTVLGRFLVCCCIRKGRSKSTTVKRLNASLASVC